ncbi:Lantibiotic dehydratase, C terminus [Streptomyces sp. DvalAA-14]|uniref:lantibiotic dehydratase n=1 Tax=unclassified Streptomyces TaxID=2593676 RepID=UPI00081B9861|nr:MULTISPECIES: lantibiotic dehydratase [unclassified Streptomyces]MYS23179.1 hypothetical protein [Streptomyces sp. SID4948]SCE28821.1 Lantibiotic dehydratase, C terminus [Streptomyces sp. DvalAA-14]
MNDTLPQGATDPLAADPVGVRVAGLPADALDDSRIPLSTGRALRIVALDLEIHADAEQIGEALYALIATERALPFKPRLVGLRRAVHRGGRLRALVERAAPPEVIGAELTARLHRHTELQDARQDMFEQLAAGLPGELRSAAAALAKLAEDPLFGLGLGYASPDLYDDVLRWAERERVRPGRRPLDRAAVSLAKYAARAVAKPSPLTTFAASGLGRWASEVDAAATGVDPLAPEVDASASGVDAVASGVDAAVRLEGSVRAEVVEVGLLPLARIAGALAHLPELDGVAHIRVSPSATLVPSADGSRRWLFTAPGPSGVVRSLPATPALDAILAAARDAGTPAGLRARLGSAAAGARGRPSDPGAGERADAVLAQLVRLGLLECRVDLPDQRLGAATLVRWLDARVPAARRGERLTLLGEDLRAIRDRAAAPPPSDPAAHRDIAATLRARTADAARRLGLLEPGDGLEQVTPYFHNTVIPGNAATLDRGSWHQVLADLALVPCLLAPFDALAPRRDHLLRRAAAAYGTGFRQPFAAVLRDFGAWWGSTTTAAPTERDARRQAELRGLLTATAPDADGTIRLTRDAVRALCGGWIDPHAAGDRYTCYVQPLAMPDAPAGLGLVLNTVTCGHGTGRTRTAHLLGLGADSVPQHSAGPPGAPLYAEFDASFGSTLNQRVPSVPYAIDLDGSGSDRPPSQLIRPAELEVVHDVGAGRLRLELRATGRSVRPLHLGLLATPLLPLPARMLVEAFGQNSYSFWSDWPQLWRTATHGGTPGRVARIALGSVVLRRACWFVEPGRAPARAAAESDADYLVRVHAWRTARGLPLRCYLRRLTARPAEGYAEAGAETEAGAGTEAGTGAGTGAATGVGVRTGAAPRDKDRKPVYLDFSHPHLLRIFEQAAASGHPLLLTEALPDLQDSPVHRDGRRHAAEFLIELDAASDPTNERQGPW